MAKQAYASKRLTVDLTGLSISAMYDALYSGTDYGRACMPWHGMIAGLAARFSTAGVKTVLEIGFGRCHVLDSLAACRFAVCGCEVAWDPIKDAARRGHKVIAASGMAKIPDRSYDLVLSLNLLDHLPSGESDRMLALHWRLAARGIGVLVNADPKFKLQDISDESWKIAVERATGLPAQSVRRKNAGVIFLAWRKPEE